MIIHCYIRTDFYLCVNYSDIDILKICLLTICLSFEKYRLHFVWLFTIDPGLVRILSAFSVQTFALLHLCPVNVSFEP